MKKGAKVLGLLLVLTVVLSFVKISSTPVGTGHSNVRWYTFSEAVEAQKKSHRLIMVDVYTSWCGPCKMMAAYTFEHPVIAKLLNENFYPVKFNAETRDTVTFNNVYFVNQSPPGKRRPVHDFAISILDKQLVYPSIVFIDKDVQRLQIMKGYYKADQFEPILSYLGYGKYKTQKFEDFEKTFVPKVVAPK